MLARFWEMGPGCLLALGTDLKQSESNGPVSYFKTVISWLSFVAILTVFKIFPEEQTVFSTIVIVALTCALIATAKPPIVPKPGNLGAVYTLLSNPFLIAIGLLSYSLYLWHWPVLCLGRWTIGTPLWSLPILSTLIIAFSLISYQIVEQPLRKAVWSVTNGKTILQGLLAISVSAGVLVALGGPFKGRLFTGKGSTTVETERLASPLMDGEAGLNSNVEKLLRECNATPFLLGAKS